MHEFKVRFSNGDSAIDKTLLPA
jgi:hypothetical protein